MGRVAQVAGTDEETQWVGDGVRKGVVGLASGVFSGLDETRHMAYQGLRKDGTQGLVLGLGKGLTTKLGKNVVMGAAGLVNNVAEGVAATADKVIDGGVEAGDVATSGAANWWGTASDTSAAVGVSRMAVVKDDFDASHPEWSDAGDCIEIHSGSAVKLLDDSEESRWKVSFGGQEGYVHPSCLLVRPPATVVMQRHRSSHRWFWCADNAQRRPRQLGRGRRRFERGAHGSTRHAAPRLTS